MPVTCAKARAPSACLLLKASERYPVIYVFVLGLIVLIYFGFF